MSRLKSAAYAVAITSALIVSGISTATHAAAATTTSLGTKVLGVAKAQIGKPYQLGATGTRKFDCSGLIYYSRFKDTNRSHHSWFNTAQNQYNHTKRISTAARAVGDLIFFGNSSKSIYHVGILKDKNYMIAAPYPGKNVRAEYIGPGSWWAKHARIYYGRMA
jgi:cell wall-associated NlpC family hydrolase